jgi:hypothetical protein
MRGGHQRLAQRPSMDSQGGGEYHQADHRCNVADERPHVRDEEAALGLQKSREEARENQHETHGDEETSHPDSQVVAGALEATSEEVHQLGGKGPHREAQNSKENSPHECYLIDQDACAIWILLLVAQVPRHHECPESSREEAEHEAGDHHSDEKCVGLPSRAELARDDHFAGEAHELAEEGNHGDEYCRLGDGLLVQEPGQGRSARRSHVLGVLRQRFASPSGDTDRDKGQEIVLLL